MDLKGTTMSTTKPKIDTRAARHTVGIRVQVPMSAFKDVIPQLLGEVLGWLGQKKIAPSGAPFMRFHTISTEYDIEIGAPVAEALAAEGRVIASEIPAGRYAWLVYTGRDDGYAGNKVLIDWAAEQGLGFDCWDTATGDAFRARYESFLTNPNDQPDPTRWETEVAIRLAD
jgi:effector-binding domain-containing protein